MNYDDEENRITREIDRVISELDAEDAIRFVASLQVEIEERRQIIQRDIEEMDRRHQGI